MTDFRNEKITNRVREIASIWIEKESEKSSMITVTRVEMTPDSKTARIMISVLPREKENAAYGFVRRNLGELRKYMTKNLRINPVPFLEVAIDEGEKNRQKIDELLTKNQN